MKKIDLGQLIGALANVGVISGIIFLGYELRQNTLATQLQTAESYTSEMNEMDYFRLANPFLAEITRKAIDGEPLTREEGSTARVYARIVFRVWQSAFYQYQNSSLDDRFLVQMSDMIQLVMNNDPIFQRYWITYRDSMDAEFREYIETIVDESVLQTN